MRSRIGFLLVPALQLVGCGGDDSNVPPVSEAGVDAFQGAQPDSGTATFEAAPNEGGEGCASADDPPDDMGVDDNCDGFDGVVGKDVYVNATAGTATNVGTPSAPLRSLDAALTLAVSRGGRVLMSSGMYDATGIDQNKDWAIFGGYSAGFLGAPTRGATTIQAPATGLFVGKSTGAGDGGAATDGGALTGKGSIAHLTIQGADAKGDQQATAHALRVQIADLELDDVAIVAGAGRDGSAGMVGANGAQGVDQVGPVHGAPMVQSGASGLTCDGVAAATFTNGATGNSKGAAADYGGTGPNGTAGGKGPDAIKSPALVQQLLAWGTASIGLSDATPGLGGAGGMSFGTATISNVSYLVGAGGGGTGGCAGKAGTGGASGGGSVALLVLSGHVKVTRSLFKTDAAGNGGDGGAGGAGGPGGAGGIPPANTAPTGFGNTDVLPGKCVSATPSDVLGNACHSYGGSGGQGGKGGFGGAGAGGWTIGLANVSSATIDVDATTQFQLGKPGLGGLSGQARGSDGEKHNTYQLP